MHINVQLGSPNENGGIHDGHPRRRAMGHCWASSRITPEHSLIAQHTQNLMDELQQGKPDEEREHDKEEQEEDKEEDDSEDQAGSSESSKSDSESDDDDD